MRLTSGTSAFLQSHPGDGGIPAVTDEEESGSTTSSCDEQVAGGLDTSDTASAGSPAKHGDVQNVLSKEPARAPEPRTQGDRDYDSSATVSFIISHTIRVSRASKPCVALDTLLMLFIIYGQKI